MAPLSSILKFKLSWKQLLLGDSVDILSSYWNRARVEFLWLIWKLRNSYVFIEAYQAPRLKTLFVDINFQAHKLKVN